MTANAQHPPRVRLSVGMLLPSGNIVAERQIRAMLAPGVELHTTRLALTGSSDEDLARMTDRLEEAAGLLADAHVDLIAFNCTAVSMHEPAMDARIADRIKTATGIRAVTTAEAIIAALETLAANRVALVTPYIEAVTKREAAFLAHHGVDVMCEASYGINSNWDMAQVSGQTWRAFAREHRQEGADACLMSCTAIESAEVIEDIERDLDCPVVTSNQALAWYCQRIGGIEDAVEGFGALLSSVTAKAPVPPQD